MRKFFKILLYIIGSILILLIGIVIWLNTPSGENFVRGKAESFLRNKLKTDVRIGELGYGLPKFVVLKNVLFKDQKQDTLLAVGELKVDINMLKLLHKDVDVQQLLLEGVHSHIYRNAPDTNYNFTYIINAFTSNKPADPNKKKDTSSSSLHIDLDRVVFGDIHVRFDDYTGGMRLALNMDTLNLKMKKLDLDSMQFHIKDLLVAGLQTTFMQDTSYLPPKIDTSTAKTQLQLIADNIDLRRINFQYNDNLNKLLFGLNLRGLNVKLDKFDMAKNLVDINKLALDTTGINIVMGRHATAPAPIDTIIKKDTTEGWHIVAKDIRFADVNFKMDNDNQPRQPAGIDYAHLDVRNLNIDLEDLLYTSDSILGNLKHLSVYEQSGLDVKELRTVFNYNQQGATLRNLYAATPNSILQDYIEVHYPSLDALKTNMGALQLKLNVVKSIVGFRDVLVFVPALAKQDLFRKYKDGHLQLEAIAGGTMGSLNINRFYLAGMSNTEILLNGRLSGLPDANKISYNLNIARFQSSRNDVSALVPAKDLASIRIPDKFGVSGQVAGTTKDYATNLMLMSTDGGAYAKGNIMMSPGKGRERYDMFVKTTDLNVGRILKKDSLLGRITASMNIKGQSFDIKTMNATFNGAVQYAYVKDYGYHGITLNGNINREKGNLNFNSIDTNLHINLVANADLSGKYIAAKAKMRMDSINFQALHLYATELRTRGIIDLDFPELNPDYPKGSFVWQQPVITANGARYFLDSLYVISNPSADTGQNIVADFDIMHAVIRGKTPLTKIGAIIQSQINKHYTTPTTDSINHAIAMGSRSDTAKTTDTAKAPGDYQLTIQAHIIDRPLLHSLVPALTSFDSIHIDGNITPRTLALNVNIPEVVYNKTTTLQNGNVQVRGSDSAFTYKVTVDQIAASQFKLWYANIHGDIARNGITTNVSISDSAKKEQFALAATLDKRGDTQVVQLQPGLKLDYNTWAVQQPNRIALVKDGFYVQNFKISNNNQYININSDQPRANTPIKIDISNFLLANLTQIISKDTLLANGLLGGNVTIEKLNPSPQIAGDLRIDNLSVFGDTIGNMSIKVNNKDANAINTDVAITGNGNDVTLTGNYYMQPVNGNSFDFMLGLKPLAIKSIEGATFGAIRGSSGYLRGDLRIDGTPSAPSINGELTTDQMATTISMLNAYFKMPSEKLQFTNHGIVFNNFSIYDSAGNKATITGNVNTTDLSDPELNMHIAANNWRALHSTAQDNKTFYGDLLLTTNLNVKGTPSAPDVNGSLNILKGTNLSVVMPESDPQVESSVGIVKFVDMDDTGRYNYIPPRTKHDTTKIAKLKIGSNINVNLGVSKDASFSLVIDQASGDYVSVRGDATINAAVTPGGVLALSGTYELYDGTYQMNYNFIKRKFTIQRGSTITFAGDPTNANLDLTAIYEADVAPYDLIQQEVTDQAQLNYYKQNLPFNVLLHMKGELTQPSLTFDVVLPDNKIYPISADQIELVRGKLNQIRTDTSELNKQVFALLILNRFVADDPFSSGAGGGGLGLTAMASVSRFIGEQLDQFAKGLIKGVDLSVDAATTEDYTTGDMRQRTDLNVAASKRLLNDRLKLTIGNDFELQGPQTDNNTQSSLIPTNLAADYLLTADGRYTLRAYRRNYDEGVLEGYVTETGLGFIVSLDYNHFRNVFNRKKNAKKEQSTGAKQ